MEAVARRRWRFVVDWGRLFGGVGRHHHRRRCTGSRSVADADLHRLGPANRHGIVSGLRLLALLVDLALVFGTHLENLVQPGALFPFLLLLLKTLLLCLLHTTLTDIIKSTKLDKLTATPTIEIQSIQSITSINKNVNRLNRIIHN